MSSNPVYRTKGNLDRGLLKCHLIGDPVFVSQASLNDVPANTVMLVGVVAFIVASTVRIVQTIFSSVKHGFLVQLGNGRYNECCAEYFEKYLNTTYKIHNYCILHVVLSTVIL